MRTLDVRPIRFHARRTRRPDSTNETAPALNGRLRLNGGGRNREPESIWLKRWIAFVANERGCLDRAYTGLLVVAFENVTQDQCGSRIDAHNTDCICRFPRCTDQDTIPDLVRESNVITANDFNRGGIVLQFVESTQRKTAIGICFGFAAVIAVPVA